MASIQIHKERIKEHLQEIEGAIYIGLEKRPATIGLHTSAGSISLVELYLHVLGKITSGTVLKHEWFKRPFPGQKQTPLAERKIKADFFLKKEIFSLMYDLEEERNKLIYGRSNINSIENALESFNKLYQVIRQELSKKGEEI